MAVSVIKRILKGQQVSDGAGVKLNRLIANGIVDNIDPFFLLDEFRSNNPDDYIAGFPMHPHRGIETITYLIEGNFKHQDSRGGGGELSAGDVQWMTAGKGIQHEEMPVMEQGHLWGYQLWLNLPKKLKWVEPKYQHLCKDELPVVKKEGMQITIISGNFEGTKGPAQNHVPSEYYDVSLEKGRSIEIFAQMKFNSLLYIRSGKIKIDGQLLETGLLIELNENNRVVIESLDEDSKFLFLSAIPNNEPYARGGPFVMNTREEIQEAFDDYNNGTLF